MSERYVVTFECGREGEAEYGVRGVRAVAAIAWLLSYVIGLERAERLAKAALGRLTYFRLRHGHS